MQRLVYAEKQRRFHSQLEGRKEIGRGGRRKEARNPRQMTHFHSIHNIFCDGCPTFPMWATNHCSFHVPSSRAKPGFPLQFNNCWLPRGVFFLNSHGSHPQVRTPTDTGFPGKGVLGLWVWARHIFKLGKDNDNHDSRRQIHCTVLEIVFSQAT